MNRNARPATRAVPLPDSEAPETYDDTDSDADSANDEYDFLEPDTDGESDDEDTDDDALDDERVPRNPRDDEYHESKATRGLSLAARTLLHKNVVSRDFLDQSVRYIRVQPNLRNEDASAWRRRARYAIRGGDPILARKLIQQAQFLKLCQNGNADKEWLQDWVKQGTSPGFVWFIQHTYTRYLNCLREAEADGLLQDRRRSMLEPWAQFVQQTWGEDIMTTLSSSKRSITSTWVRVVPVPPPPPPPPNQRRDSDSQPQSHGPAIVPDNDAVAHTRSAPQLQTRSAPELEWEANEKTLVAPSPKEGNRPRGHLGYPQTQHSKKKSLDVIEPLRQRLDKVVRIQPEDVNQDPDDDDDEEEDNDEDDEDNDDNNAYVHTKGLMGSQTMPRSAPTSRVPPTTIVTKHVVPPEARASNHGPYVPALLQRFLALTEFRDHRDFCSRNPELLEEDFDLSPLEALALSCLRQKRRTIACRAIRCSIMLRNARAVPEDPLGYFGKLALALKKKIDELDTQCRTELKRLEAKSEEPEEEDEDEEEEEDEEERPEIQTRVIPKLPPTTRIPVRQQVAPNTRAPRR